MTSAIEVGEGLAPRLGRSFPPRSYHNSTDYLPKEFNQLLFKMDMEPFLCVVRIEMFVYSLNESLPFRAVLWLRDTVEFVSLSHNGGTTIVYVY